MWCYVVTIALGASETFFKLRSLLQSAMNQNSHHAQKYQKLQNTKNYVKNLYWLFRVT